jgi:hypothetical protein
MATRAQENHPVKWIMVNDCGIVWPDAQRAEKERHVSNIAENFDPDKLGVVHLADRNGHKVYHICDGQHRIAALKRIGYGDQLIMAVIHPIKTAAEAAALFNALNGPRAKPAALDMFKTGVTEGVEPQITINRIVKGCGFNVGANATRTRCIAAVGALNEIYRRFGEVVLAETLKAVSGTWRDDPNATDGPIIKGFGMLIGMHGDKIDYPRLRERVAKKYTAASLLGAAKAQRAALGGAVGDHVRALLEQAHDQRLRNGGRLAA